MVCLSLVQWGNRSQGGINRESDWTLRRIRVTLDDMSKPPGMIIPPELEEEMTPAVKAFVLVLLHRLEQLESKVRELEAENERLAKKDAPEIKTGIKKQ